ncbi:hypothetical protein J1P26_23470 [Neobacillus sp. MM2021_6]|uniref:hypothetical protein n=1 Tax=Bacillaceae TaxID=186817 RepID=UPI0014083ABE|nr:MULTISPECIES: hypothetical protein [Bacillaceae]MBO0962661.1 hypothetical protein [Neobacillus sp. MM2021_6]NHC21411.1 hypothetical protein [Bacillus sp. MM2020_4]
MKKKWITAGTGLGIGAVLLLVSGFSAMANTNGYDAYKTALKNTKAKTSITTNVDLTITDNGKRLVTGAADLKVNKDQKAGSMAATIGDSTEQHSINVFRQDEKLIFKSSEEDVYKIKKINTPKWQYKGNHSNSPKVMEHVIGVLLGNSKELASVENQADGSKRAELHLSGDQVPAVVNTVESLIVSKMAIHENNEKAPDWMANMPRLSDNSKVEKIDMAAEISTENMLEEQTVKLTIHGTDESGKDHELTINIHVDYSDFNKTVPERIDITGKKIVEIKNEGMRRGWRH